MSAKEAEKLVRSEPIDELYNIGQELGRGKFAIVKRCTEKSTGEQYAAKYLRKRRGGKSCRDDILVEIDIMRQATNHHRIVKIKEVFESQREMIIIIELATGGELFRMIAVDPLPEDKAKNIVWELLEGVQHLHALSIVHLDLKPENVLLYRKGQLDIKIADFGLAMQISPGQQVRTLVGTAEYVAPEILNYEPISVMADMWSIGALTYALLTGYSPFQGETHNDTFYNVSICEYDFEDEVFDDVSQNAKDFIEELLQKKPSARLTATQCLQHPWMQSITATPTSTQNPQNQCLNSSTSSLDSAMWLDSTSSLEPSPISSASSSFAPRPNGSKSNEEELQQPSNKQNEDMTQVVSKLCTEMQKASGGNDAGLLINSNLDGSASSISSNESCNTLKPDEEDGGVFIPRSTTPLTSSPPAGKRTESASSLCVEEDARSISRPSSGMRITTPVQSDMVSYSPETIEQLKKLERLKQRKLKEAEKEGKNSDTLGRRGSSPVTSICSRLKISACKSQSDAGVSEVKERSKSPIFTRSSAKEKNSPIAEQRGLVSSDARQSPVFISRKLSPPSPTDNTRLESPIFNSRRLNPLSTDTTKQTVSGERKVNHDEVTDSSRSPEPRKSKHTELHITPTQNKDQTSLNRSNIENTSSPNISTSGRNGHLVSSSESVTLSSTSFRTPSPVNNRSKSYSPQSISKPAMSIASSTSSARTSKSTSPVSASGSSNIVFRNKAVKNKTKDWRKTPHIDPDAIAAILNGDIDTDSLFDGGSMLETCAEETEPTPTDSPSVDSDMTEKKTQISPTITEDVSSILKKKADSDSVVRRNKKTVVIAAKKQRTAKHQSIYFGSPERSPGSQDGLRNNHLLGIQHQRSSLTMSYSSPDLTLLVGGNKTRSSKKPKREDSYVTGSGTPKESNRRSFLGGVSLSRSLTISGKGSKRNTGNIRDKYKLKTKELQ